jgi:hypothetical protein
VFTGIGGADERKTPGSGAVVLPRAPRGRVSRPSQPPLD